MFNCISFRSLGVAGIPVGLLQRDWTDFDVRYLVNLAPGNEGELTDEEEKAHQGTDCLCSAAGRVRHKSCQGVAEGGISDQTVYRWKNKSGGLMPSEACKLRQLEAENGRLRRLVADLFLDNEMLQKLIRRQL